MAVDQPPIDAALSGFEADAAAAPETEFWRNLWPWDDLNAKSPPEQWQQFRRDVLPVLAAMVAVRSPSGPRALAADATGRLQTSGFPMFSDVTTGLSPFPGSTLIVADATIYAPGMWVLIPNLGAASPNFQADYLGRVRAAQHESLPSGVDLVTVDPAPNAVIAGGTVFMVLPPPPDWLPVAPWRAPNLVPPQSVAQVGAGTTRYLNGSANQVLYVHGIFVAVQVAVAGAIWRIQDTAGPFRVQGVASAIGNIYLDMGGAPIGGPGAGIDVAVVGGAATVTFSIFAGLG